MQQLISSRTQLENLAAVLAPEQLTSAAPEERAARAELCMDAIKLLEDAELAVDSGEPMEVVVALVNAIDGLAVQLRDRVLDDVVASSPAPDHLP
ncbi:hypothetical protein [Streptomyces sp. NPDC046909]|uniref:hypothetical protein n=1 Tax=Streptomyces sp. NPDC046909 TaxID=3155617 RepID=UPI0033DCCB68